MPGEKKRYVAKRLRALQKGPDVPPSLLSSLDIELTERCNNNCLHCGINLSRDHRSAIAGEMSTAEIGSILKDAAELGCLIVKFTGGEPLLRKDFSKIYQEARFLGLKVSIFTNGTLVDSYIAGLLRDIPPLQPVEITLYGMTPRSYEAVTRNPGSYTAARACIELLLEYGISFTLKFAVLPQNREEVELFQKYCRDLFPAAPNPSLVQFFNPRVRRDSFEKNRIIARQKVSPEHSIEFFRRYLPEYLDGLQQFLTQFSGPQGPGIFGCDAGLRRGCVDAYGRFAPCLLLKADHYSYDLKTGTLKEAMSAFFPAIRRTAAEDPAYLERCSRCFLKSLCEQCPARSWMEHGVLDRPVEYYCELAHAQARYLGVLGPHEYAWLLDDWRARLRECFAEEKT